MHSIRRFAAIFLGLIASFASCKTTGLDVARISPETSLRETALAWAHSFETRDPNEILKFYTEDAIAWYPRHTRPVIGHTANSATWAAYFKNNPAHPVSVESVDAAASGDLGVTSGKYLYKEATDPTAEGGRYVAVWHRFGTQWRIILLSAHKHDDVSGSTFKLR